MTVPPLTESHWTSRVITPRPMRGTLEERLWYRVDRNGPDHPSPDLGQCWLWTGPPSTKGYGKICLGGHRSKKIPVHVASYELSIGPVPDGMTLDHLCHTFDPSCPGGATCWHRLCVNPAHLEPVLPAENSARGRGNRNLEKTHCPDGHPYAGENLIEYVHQGRIFRGCRECRNKRNRQRMAAKRQGRGVRSERNEHE